MRRVILRILIACLAFTSLTMPTRAEPARTELVTMDEALDLAQNYVALVTHREGDWGGSNAADVAEVRELKRGSRVVGYFCRVKPSGFIVVPLRKELGTIKAYSQTTDINPDCTEGLADLIKVGMERQLDWSEELVGPIALASADDLDSVLEINYRPAWDELEGDPAVFKERLESDSAVLDYSAGGWLLTSNWIQGDPYNRQCPAPPSGDDCTASRCTVGCVATAGAQVMRYWSWPPYGKDSPYNDSYDWANMPDTVTGSSHWAEINAVAELSHEVGVAAGMDYCGHDSSPCASGAFIAGHAGRDLLDGLEDHFRYSTSADDRDRDDYTATGWFNLIKGELNRNRPLIYRVEGHAIVCDGWKEEGSTPSRYYHMNYGWGRTADCQTGCNAWYLLDALHLGGKSEEMLLENVYPVSSMHTWLGGWYSVPSFPYRYFNVDATGHDAAFAENSRLQFLPGVTVKCTSPEGGKISFRGWSTSNSYLFARGDLSAGVRINSGHIYLYRDGAIKLH